MFVYVSPSPTNTLRPSLLSDVRLNERSEPVTSASEPKAVEVGAE
jgi:hypothetical protein